MNPEVRVIMEVVEGDTAVEGSEGILSLAEGLVANRDIESQASLDSGSVGTDIQGAAGMTKIPVKTLRQARATRMTEKTVGAVKPRNKVGLADSAIVKSNEAMLPENLFGTVGTSGASESSSSSQDAFPKVTSFAEQLRLRQASRQQKDMRRPQAAGAMLSPGSRIP